MATALVIRFADQVSPTATTHDRLKAMADHLGVSQNKAAHIAINRLYEECADDIAIEDEFRKHGRKVGGITYLGVSDDFIRRVEDRIARRIPLPHEDDESLERFLLFRFLTKDQQAAVKAEPNFLVKRQMITKFLDDLGDEISLN